MPCRIEEKTVVSHSGIGVSPSAAIEQYVNASWDFSNWYSWINCLGLNGVYPWTFWQLAASVVLRYGSNGTNGWSCLSWSCVAFIKTKYSLKRIYTCNFFPKKLQGIYLLHYSIFDFFDFHWKGIDVRYVQIGIIFLKLVWHPVSPTKFISDCQPINLNVTLKPIGDL